MTEPIQKPRGTSKQTYRTPRDFLAAVQATFGPIALDLAADSPHVCERWLGPGSPWGAKFEDAFAVDWFPLVPTGRIAYLNPPFSNIAPWARKCVEQAEKGLRIILLTPFTCGNRQDIVYPHALTLGLRPRLTFDGESSPYPKDIQISILGFGMVGTGTWRWTDALARRSSAR